VGIDDEELLPLLVEKHQKRKGTSLPILGGAKDQKRVRVCIRESIMYAHLSYARVGHAVCPRVGQPKSKIDTNMDKIIPTTNIMMAVSPPT
jgi:hypothetical protein